MVVSDMTILIGIITAVSIWIYGSISKIMGGIFIMVAGLGTMYATTGNDTWVGMALLAIGLGLTLTAPFGKKKKR